MLCSVYKGGKGRAVCGSKDLGMVLCCEVFSGVGGEGKGERRCRAMFREPY